MEKYSILKAISEKESLVNQLTLKKEQKEMLFPLPKSSNLKGELVNGGVRNDKTIEYLIKMQKIDIEIDQIEQEIKMLDKYIQKENERLKKYSEWEKLVISLRESRKTWVQIACSVPYSIRTCKEIYYKYKRGLNEQ